MNEVVFAFKKHVIPYQISPYKLKLEKNKKSIISRMLSAEEQRHKITLPIDDTKKACSIKNNRLSKHLSHISTTNLPVLETK